MQKIKLFMMLALLVAGVSGAWARTYTVQYRGLPSGQTGDYQVTTPWKSTNYTNYYVRLVKGSSTSLTATEYRYYGGSWYSQNDDSEDMANIHYNIRPLTIDGYDVTMTSSYKNRTITITYSPSSVVKWHDDIFEYSTRHTQATGDVQDLPSNQVSISLWLGRNENEFEEITDTISFFGPLWDNATVGQTRTLPDYYNNDITATASYEYLGTLPNHTPSTGTYFYLRTRTIPISTVTNVVIPRQATNPDNQRTYDVTAIQKWGFCYIASDCNPRYVCDDDDYDQWEGRGDQEEALIKEGLAEYDYGNINDHRNDYLVNVRFESPSNITQIGDYAFMSNKALKSIIVPSSVELLGQGVWECCRALTDLRFQTTTVTRNGETFEGVKFTTIKNFTFWYCTALETLVLPEGITTIEGQAIGAPLQYMFALTDLKLPNTLTSIGAHFVCCCNSLETLTIPAGVTSISGACFHGCESLKTVYLLGTASSLEAASGTSNTFGVNEVFCRDHVNNCTFYTTADYIASYAQTTSTSWYKIADNRDQQGYLLDEKGNRIKDANGNYVRASGTADGYGNKLTIMKGEERTFEKNKWVTACFYTDIANYKSVFGEGAIAAKMIDTDRRGSIYDKDGNLYTYARGNDPYRYHVSFEEIQGTTIPKDLPILIYPTVDATVEVTPNMNTLSEPQKEDLTVLRSSEVEARFTDGPNQNKTAKIKMLSHFVDGQRLNVGDFYFKSNGVVENGAQTVIGSFKRVVAANKAPYIGWFRCYWQVDIDNVVDNSNNSKMEMMSYYWDDEVDGVKNVERQPEIIIDGIYDLQGRKFDVKQEDLPEGLYIVNGKKVLKK